jgi:hypothetical protein
VLQHWDDFSQSSGHRRSRALLLVLVLVLLVLVLLLLLLLLLKYSCWALDCLGALQHHS